MICLNKIFKLEYICVHPIVKYYIIYDVVNDIVYDVLYNAVYGIVI